MTLDVLRKTGGWCVELQQPLKTHTGEVTAIEIRPATADHVIRWGGGRIPSVLALLSELCDLPERVLRQLPASEFDRVMFAFLNSLPQTIRADVGSDDPDAVKRPLATPEDQLPQSAQVPPPDQQDPRFPAVDGPVVRLTERKPPPPHEDRPMDLAPPPISEAVNR